MSKSEKGGLSKLLNSLLTLIIVILLIAVGGYAFLKIKYQIDVLATINQLKTLSQSVDESEFNNKFSNEDKSSLQTKLNESFETTLINYDSENNNYIMNTDLSSINLTNDIYLNSVECGALIDIMISSQEEDLSVNLGSLRLKLSLIQMEFSSVSTINHRANVNVVLKADLSELKSSLTSFPLNIFNNYIPNNLYISATTTLTRSEIEPFEYSLTDCKLKINKLSETDTNQILSTLNKIMSLKNKSVQQFDVEEISKQVCEPFIQCLIKSPSNSGFSYALRDYVSKFDFGYDDGVSYFVLLKKIN